VLFAAFPDNRARLLLVTGEKIQFECSGRATGQEG
jgi:hypothetical protein